MAQLARIAPPDPKDARLTMSNARGRAWHRLSPGDQAALTAAGYIRTWQPGDFIALQGDPPGGLIVILHGRVKISVTNDRGESAPIAARGPGHIIGELSPIADVPRTATMQAIEETRSLIIPRDRLLAVLAKNPAITNELLSAAAIRLQESDRLRLETGGPDFSARFASLLVELCAQCSPDAGDDDLIDLPFGQEELAGFARVSRSTLVRGLDELRTLGVIKTSRRRVTIVRLRALRDLAHGKEPFLNR
jgi:CRP/FNR family transcriptional regulator, cyclic AMP receptor protein